MIDIKHLIDYLPFYYKSKDTYKDDNGQGILEKLLEICGTYFQDNIKAEIDSSLEILDIGSTSEYYLNFLWEMLGQIPFARISTDHRPLSLSEEQQRNLIKYTNTLLKIRGTEKFFQVMFGVFSNESNKLAITITSDDPGWEKDEKELTVINYSYFNTDSFDDDNIRMDEYYRMKQCINVTFNITGKIGDQDYQALIAFIKRFVPYFVHPIIYINGKSMEETYTMKLFKYDKFNFKWEEAGDSTKVQGVIDLLFKVVIYDSFGNEVSKDFESWLEGGTKTHRTSPYTFTVSGIINDEDLYHFKLGNEEIIHIISKEAVAVPTYTISTPEIISENKKIDGEHPSVTVRVKATKIFHGIAVPVNVINKTTNQIELVGDDGYATFVITKGGTYKFSPSPSYTIESSIVIKEDAIIEDAYNVFVRRLAPIVEHSWSKASTATITGANGRSAIFQVKLVFNHVPSGLIYDGAPLTADILSTLTEAQAKAEMSEVDFAKVQPIIQNAVAVPADIPSTSIQSGSTWIVPNNGAYLIRPKYGSQDDSLWAVVTRLSVSLTWDVNLLDGSTQKPSMELNITNEVSSVEATVQITQTSTPLLGNTNSDNSLKSLTIITADGTNLNLKYEDTKVGGSDFSVEWLDKSGTDGVYKVNVTSKIPGTFSFRMSSGSSTIATLTVNDARIPIHTKDEVTGILILPVNNNGWLPTTSEDLIGLNRIYQLSKDDTEAKFRIVPAYRNTDGTIHIYDDDADEFGEFIMPDGSNEVLGTTITLKEVGTYTFKYKLESADEDEGIPAKYSEVTLEIKDWQSTVNLEVTPSTGALKNGQAIAILRVSSNKPTDTLLIKELVTGDIYKDGDTFTAYSVTPDDKPYTFVPVVNGNVVETNPDGTPTKKTFKVIDPSAITVEPIKLEWDAEDLTPKTLTIIPGDESTEWVIVVTN